MTKQYTCSTESQHCKTSSPSAIGIVWFDYFHLLQHPQGNIIPLRNASGKTRNNQVLLKRVHDSSCIFDGGNEKLTWLDTHQEKATLPHSFYQPLLFGLDSLWKEFCSCRSKILPWKSWAHFGRAASSRERNRKSHTVNSLYLKVKIHPKYW